MMVSWVGLVMRPFSFINTQRSQAVFPLSSDSFKLNSAHQSSSSNLGQYWVLQFVKFRQEHLTFVYGGLAQVVLFDDFEGGRCYCTAKWISSISTSMLSWLDAQHNVPVCQYRAYRKDTLGQ